jgi:S1-C subfamily serine protease
MNEAEAKARGIEFRRGVLAASVDPESTVGAEIPEGSIIVEAFGAPVGSVDDLYLRIERGVPPTARRIEIPLTVVRPDGKRVQFVVPLRPPTR